jgi:hypothetical protein
MPRDAIAWEPGSRAGTLVRAHRVAAGAEKRGTDGDADPANHALGRAVGGQSTKIQLLSDGHGRPLDAMLTPGQTHESTQAAAVSAPVAMERARGRVRRRPRRVAMGSICARMLLHSRHSSNFDAWSIILL